MHVQFPVLQRTQDVTLHSLKIQFSKRQDCALLEGGSSQPWYSSKTSQCSPWNMATLQPKEHQVSLSLDVSNMAFPTGMMPLFWQEKYGSRQFGSISSDLRLSLQAKLTGTYTDSTIGKNNNYSSDSIQVSVAQSNTIWTHIQLEACNTETSKPLPSHRSHPDSPIWASSRLRFWQPEAKTWQQLCHKLKQAENRSWTHTAYGMNTRFKSK